jgi:hypothetical protein
VSRIFKNHQLKNRLYRIVSGSVLTLFLALCLVGGVHAQDAAQLKPTVGKAVRFDISPPLRSMRIIEAKESEKGEDDRGAPGPVNDTNHDPDPVVQRWHGDGIFSQNNVIPGTGISFNGMTNTATTTPPDTVGDVGPNHYVQMVNTRFQVFNKSGTSAFGPASINTLWAGFGGPCQTENAGDPVVLHDQLADRWLLTQFTAAGPTYFNCVALSTTNDPTGTYYRWAFTTGTNFPDYPKYGIWSDGYYISTREFAGAAFAGVGAYALNRDQMLLGNPAPQVVSFVFPPTGQAFRTGDGLLPADLDGTILPPVGSPQYYVGSMDGGGPYGALADALNLFKFTVNWTTPASSTFVFSDQINVAAFDSIFPCTPTSRACIAEPGTTTKIDILSYRQRPLHRLAYRNYGTHESLLTTQSVEATTGIAGMRWWEIRSPNSSPIIFQEGTYSPDIVHRWMGSLAADNKGNMLLGFSVSDGTTISPGIRYTGRLVTDPLGTMPQGEGTMIAGGGSQTSTGNRWGDYSSMNIDPMNDCTFWYTTEYYAATSTSTWSTRISSVTFPSCVAPTAATVSVSGRVTSPSGTPVRGVVVSLQRLSNGQVRTALTNGFGYFRFYDIPSGETYFVSASSKRFVFLSKVISLSDSLTELNFVAEPGAFATDSKVRRSKKVS